MILAHSLGIAGGLRASLFALALACTAPLASAQQERATPSPFAQASNYFRGARYPAAYGRFIVLADAGDRDAARIALMMYRYGKDLFGHEWYASDPQIALWTRLAGSGGTEVAGAEQAR